MLNKFNGIFQVWNPRFNPDTLLNHAQELVATSEKKGKKRTDKTHAWWGKIGYAGRPGQILPYIKQLQSAAEAGNCWLFLTDYRSLHACPVDKIEYVTDDKGNICPCPQPEGAVPAYYSELGYDVLYWFRLRDIILIEDEQIPALERLSDLIDERDHQLDLYASRKYEYPIPVTISEESPLQEQLSVIDRNRVYAADTLSLPQGVHKAFVELQDILNPEFDSLSNNVQVFLADGKFNYDIERTDYSSSILQLVKAYEVLIRNSFIPSLIGRWKIAGRDDVMLNPVKGHRMSLLQLTENRDDFLPLAYLIDAVFGNRSIFSHYGEEGEWLSRKFARDFKSFLKNFRNPAIHESRVPKAVITDLYKHTICQSDASWIVRLNRFWLDNK